MPNRSKPDWRTFRLLAEGIEAACDCALRRLANEDANLAKPVFELQSNVAELMASNIDPCYSSEIRRPFLRELLNRKRV